MPQLLTKRRLGLFVLFLLITAGLTMPATAAKKTRIPTEQVPGLLIGQWRGSALWIPEISLDVTSVQGGRIRGVGREFGSKCTGPYEIRGEITKKGKIIYTRLPTESCPEYVFKLKMFRTKAGGLIMIWSGVGAGFILFRVSATTCENKFPVSNKPGTNYWDKGDPNFSKWKACQRQSDPLHPAVIGWEKGIGQYQQCVRNRG